MHSYQPYILIELDIQVVCKLVESIIRDNMIKYFTYNNFFSQKQFGFIKGFSTVIQLLKMLDKKTRKWRTCRCRYTDFEKAFDKVPHKRLIIKLALYGIDSDTIEWIKAFLFNRKQENKEVN